MGDNIHTVPCQDRTRMLQELQSVFVEFSEALKVAVAPLKLAQPPTSTPNAKVWMQELLDGPPEHFRSELGVRKNVFEQLVQELSAQGHTGCKKITLEQQLAIFLYVCASGLSCRHIGGRLGLSNETIKE